MSDNPIDPRLVQDAISDLWRFYEEHAAQARQHETLRAAVTALLTGFAATIVGSVTGDGFQRAEILAGAVIMAIGFVGVLLSLKHYERNRFHTTVLKMTRDEITRLRGTQVAKSTDTLREDAEARHAKAFSRFRQRGTQEKPEVAAAVSGADQKPGEDVPKPLLVATRLFLLWLALPIVIVIAGALVVVFSAL